MTAVDAARFIDDAVNIKIVNLNHTKPIALLNRKIIIIIKVYSYAVDRLSIRCQCCVVDAITVVTYYVVNGWWSVLYYKVPTRR